MMKKYFCLVAISLFLTLNAHAYSLTADIGTPEIGVGQSFYLTLTADDNISETPDLSPLKNKFQILSTSVSRQMNIINGNQSSVTKWKIGLRATQVGQTQIPSIRIGSEQTPALSLNVKAEAVTPQTSSATAPTQTPYTIHGEIIGQPEKIYVQQQILYRVTITDDGRIQNGVPTFETETDTNWLIRSFGDPEIITRTENGKPSRVITYRYALFPQKSGHLTIPAFEFRGTAFGNTQATTPDPDFGFVFPSIFNMSTPINLYLASKEINVLPVPETSKDGWWMPAKDVRLTATWAEQTKEFRVGEAVTREITLESLGSLDSQLPELKFPKTDGMRQYPQKPVRSEKRVNGDLSATEKLDVVYIPQKQGNITLPAIQVRWFDTQNDQARVAEIPPLDIFVLPSLTTRPEMSVETEQPQVSAPKNTNEEKPLPTANIFFYVIAGMLGAFLTGLFIGLTVLFRLKKSTSPKPVCETRRYPDFIIQKARQNDFRSLRDALISWATGAFPQTQITNLQDIATASENTEFSAQIEMLTACLYQPACPKNWNAENFISAFREVLKQKKKKTAKKHPLPPLYG